MSRTGVIAVYHNEERINGVSYNAASGIVTFETKNFSPFTVVEKRVLLGGGGTKTQGGTDDEKDIRATLDLGGVVDFGGSVLYSDNNDENWGGNLREYAFKDGTVVKNLTVKGVNSATRWWKAYGNVTFENCTFESEGIYGIHIGEGDATVTFKNCTINGWNTFGSSLTKVVFDGCTFKKGKSSYNCVMTRSDTDFKNCTFVDNTGVLTAKPDTRFAWNIDNCTFDGVEMTAENINTFPYKSYTGVDSDIWTKHDLKVNGVLVTE